MARRQRHTWTVDNPAPKQQDLPTRPAKYTTNQLVLRCIAAAAAGWVAHEIYTINAILEAVGL